MQLFAWQEQPSELTAFVDSDWVGDKVSRKSTSGLMLFRGRHLVKSWSSNQQAIAMPSGEAELYAMTKGAAQVLGLSSMSADFGEDIGCTVRSDSSAALAISQRVGLGRVRHIQVQYLWIQERHYEGSLGLSKVKGEQNPADMLTKGVPQEILSRHMRASDMEPRGGLLTTTGRELDIRRVSRITQAKAFPSEMADIATGWAVGEIVMEGCVENAVVRNICNLMQDLEIHGVK